LGLGDPIDIANRQQTQFGQDAETPLKDVSSSGAISSDSWACEELNLGSHAYQAASYEHEMGSEVLTSPPFRTFCSACRAFKNILRTSTNILRMRMDTTTDTIAIQEQRSCSLAQLRFELLEPVVHHDQLVGGVRS
jgi:hypothetical protein